MSKREIEFHSRRGDSGTQIIENGDGGSEGLGDGGSAGIRGDGGSNGIFPDGDAIHGEGADIAFA